MDHVSLQEAVTVMIDYSSKNQVELQGRSMLHLGGVSLNNFFGDFFIFMKKEHVLPNELLIVCIIFTANYALYFFMIVIYFKRYRATDENLLKLFYSIEPANLSTLASVASFVSSAVTEQESIQRMERRGEDPQIGLRKRVGRNGRLWRPKLRIRIPWYIIAASSPNWIMLNLVLVIFWMYSSNASALNMSNIARRVGAIITEIQRNLNYRVLNTAMLLQDVDRVAILDQLPVDTLEVITGNINLLKNIEEQLGLNFIRDACSSGYYFDSILPRACGSPTKWGLIMTLSNQFVQFNPPLANTKEVFELTSLLPKLFASINEAWKVIPVEPIAVWICTVALIYMALNMAILLIIHCRIAKTRHKIYELYLRITRMSDSAATMGTY